MHKLLLILPAAAMLLPDPAASAGPARRAAESAPAAAPMPDAPPRAPTLADPPPVAAAPATAADPTAAMPLAPPPPPVIPPPLVVPVRPVPPPPPAAEVPGATGDAFAIPDGIRITFGALSSDLNPVTAAAVRVVAGAMPAGSSVNLDAFAAGNAEDASTARRLSLARALAVRGVLIGQGIASERIVMRSLGASRPAIEAGPPDRVDLVISPPPAQGRPAP